MNEHAETIRDLIVKSIQKEITPEEQGRLEEWINAADSNRQLFERLSNMPTLYEKLNIYDHYIGEKDLVWAKIEQRRKGRLAFIKGRRWIYAAAAILLMAVSFWVLLPQFKKQLPPVIAEKQKENKSVEPGKYKAMLTLSNGKQIVLDSATQGQLAQQDQTTILNKNGQLVYEGSKTSKGKAVVYNTLSTARGQTYATVLADGSKIWLNSSSSIKYPVVFTGTKRIVEIEGEAYLEVAHNPDQPFIVKVNGMEIEVKGTVFNVKAYIEDKVITTTLLEGKVYLTGGKDSRVLSPGQQADLDPKGNIQVTDNADIDKAVGWKSGLFVFKGDDVHEVMNQLSRWYDVNVEYKGIVKDRFYGIIDRKLPVQEVLEMMQRSTVHFQVTGRTITVTP